MRIVKRHKILYTEYVSYLAAERAGARVRLCLPLTAELKVREWHAYRAYYCGLCKELKREYGFFSRFLLNYDLVLPALLADGMAGTQAAYVCPERCMANPVEKRSMCQSTAGAPPAADALVLTV